MHPSSRSFPANAHKAMENVSLRAALAKLKQGFRINRAQSAAQLPEFEALRDTAKALKDHTLEHLDYYLDYFERQVIARGGQVHWCRDAAEARNAILEICRSVDARTVTKSKSMVSEEIAINDFLERNGVTPVETDLGEYIIQLRDEPPSHIVAPAIHLDRTHVADAFREAHEDLPKDRVLDEPSDLLCEARQQLRQKFYAADVGITGANFLVAETGTSIIVTNEGNGDLTQILPRVHVVLATLEKVVPTLEDASTLIRLLARSATGQEISVYTTLSTGPRRPEDVDGPEQFHVVLLDNGRSGMLGGPFQDMLRCIRCGACINHCPVYGQIGGHAYGWVYPGPMGSVLTPSLIGLAEAHHLPNASTFCGRCEEVCPVRIPLPRMLRHWRRNEFERHLKPARERWGLALWAFAARRPWLYRIGVQVISWSLRKLGRSGSIAHLPLATGWTSGRDFPAPTGPSFQEQWRRRGP